MNGTRLIRNLRLGWSILCGIACVLLVMLWIRSHWRFDGVTHGFADKNGIIAESTAGKLVFWYFDAPMIEESWRFSSNPPEKSRRVSTNLADLTTAGFLFSFPPRAIVVALPHWFVLAVSGLFAAIPWLRPRRRFSLRTMLIATALVAMALALIGYAWRH